MKILKVKYLDAYKLEVLFSNNEIRIADFKDFLKKSNHESIHKFLDKALFKKVIIDTGFLSWNDGEMEISAISVYDKFSLPKEKGFTMKEVFSKIETKLNKHYGTNYKLKY